LGVQINIVGIAAIEPLIQADRCQLLVVDVLLKTEWPDLEINKIEKSQFLF